MPQYANYLTFRFSTGKSPILVHPADPPFSALNFTFIKIYWNTIGNTSTESIKSYLISLTDEANTMRETFLTTKQEYTIGNIIQGVRYLYRITATDSDNRIGITSQTMEFILDGMCISNLDYCT